MRKTIFTQSEATALYPKVCQWWMAGETGREIAQRLGCKAWIVYSVLRAKGWYSFLQPLCQRCGQHQWQSVLRGTEEKVCGVCLFVEAGQVIEGQR